MFTEKARRGRPPGRTAQGEATRQQLYDTALSLFADRGYEATTLRAIAKEAEVSPGLLYRYFPSKVAVVVALYDRLSTDYAATELPTGGWAARTHAALTASLAVLRPHREALRALVPVMVADPDHGLLAGGGAASRAQVLGVFERAVAEASRPPAAAAAVAHLAYVAHLMVILFWLLDRSPGQRATDALVALVGGAAAMLGPIAWTPGAGPLLARLDTVIRDGLYG